MITDQDVADLYRCLLARAPETEGTVAAFRSYYPDFVQGRLAVLGSDEFARVFSQQTGRATAELTQRFLQRAGGVALPQTGARDPALESMMRIMIQAHGAVRVAVVIGQGGPAIEDMLPLDNVQAAILHVAPEFSALVPQTAVLPSGGTLFRVAFEPAALAAFLRQCRLPIDLLAICVAQDEWWRALLPSLGARAIVAVADQGAFPEDAGWEAPLRLPGVTVRHKGGWFLPVRYSAGNESDAPEGPIAGLTIAAIVRNERDAISNMLASVMPVADHIVVVDTGSSDDTYEVAEAVLAASGTRYTLARTPAGRFDSMRNAALDLVPDTASWVLMLDADEELCAEDCAALRVLLPSADHDAYALPRYNYPGHDKSGAVTPYPDRQVRLLRCGGGRALRYDGAVHETVRSVPVGRLPLDAGAIGLGRGGPHIHHLVRRFRSPAAEARKQEFYREIARTYAGA